MPAIIDVLMPAAGDGYAAEAAESLDGYRPAFAAHGLSLAPRPWTAGPGEGAAALALFAWGYHTDPDRWQAMLECWPGHARLFNPPALLVWNTRKTYLAELAAKGVPIVPSLFCDATEASLATAFDRFGTAELVVKPQISAGSHLTRRVRRGDPVTPMAAAIIQPFIDTVRDAGELSLFYIGGAPTHTARKVARGDDFRIQPQFGGIASPAVPPPQAIAIAERAIAAMPAAPLYARIDLLTLADGSLALIELEAIEPDLYVDCGADVREHFAAAVALALCGQ